MNVTNSDQWKWPAVFNQIHGCSKFGAVAEINLRGQEEPKTFLKSWYEQILEFLYMSNQQCIDIGKTLMTKQTNNELVWWLDWQALWTSWQWLSWHQQSWSNFYALQMTWIILIQRKSSHLLQRILVYLSVKNLLMCFFIFPLW